jgi:hypothetical protein
MVGMLVLKSARDIECENKKLANKYSPLLVLFPEIKEGSTRKNNSNTDSPKKGLPPLDQDYHPRDIGLILDSARLPDDGVFKNLLRHLGIRRGGLKPRRDQLLDAMSKNEFNGNELKYIHLIDEKGPKDVEKFWRFYAGIKDKDTKYPRKAYARVVRGSGRFENYISIQYWLAFFFNDFDNVHEMDWEMVSIILKNVGPEEQLKENSNNIPWAPLACAYNAHWGSFRKPWKYVEKVIDEHSEKSINIGCHPVAYIANGSHASYFSDYPSSRNVAVDFMPALKSVIRKAKEGLGIGVVDYVPSFEDKHTVKLLPEVEVIPDPDENGKWSGEWRWLNFTGHWGSTPKRSFIDRIWLLGTIVTFLKKEPTQEDGPVGPNVGHGSCWDKPFDRVNFDCQNDVGNEDWLETISGTTY